MIKTFIEAINYNNSKEQTTVTHLDLSPLSPDKTLLFFSVHLYST